MTVSDSPRFVIITAAFNEAAQIEATMESVVAQTVLPLCWVIVDDGSTDDTRGKIERMQGRFPWIVYYRRCRQAGQAYFASNVYALMEGVAQTARLDYEFLAILDADITLPRDYYERIFSRFDSDPQLGVASGVYENLIDGSLRKVLSDRRSTPKAIQVFRRPCFEQIGGFLPLKYGGEDTCSCIMARMNGWKSWSFPDVKVVHRRPTGVGNAKSVLRARFVQGLADYGVCTHPLFMLVKSLKRGLLESPRLLGGLLRLAGYAYGSIRREPRQMPLNVARYVRREQLRRVFGLNHIPMAKRAGSQPARCR
ncbi:MAG TPA: glycosyltransferase family A protein [Sedimentisphaerales bacterium]|nr:glycosyltransferase family A protein [Sedimentisphaerales bacterium]